MSVVLGTLLGVGLLLALSPLLWPATRFRAPRSSRLSAGIRERMVQAGLEQFSPAVLAVVCALCGVAAGATVLAVLPVLVVAVGAGIAGAALPVVLVSWRARARRRAARIVWPDVVDHLVSGLRAGQPLPEALVALAASGPTATRPAFAAFERDVRALGDVGAALVELKDRLADPVADRIVAVLTMAREVGGTELTTVLRNLGTYLRQDAAVRAEVEARQSWVQNAARLGVAAPWVVLVLLSTRPEAVRAYDSVAGAVLLVTGFVVSVLAYRLMIALGRLPEERRWFA